MSMRARFLWVFIIALGIAALSATTALAMPNLGDTGWRIFGSSLVFAGYLLGAMLCAIVLERRRFRILMMLSIIGFAAACLCTWAYIWYESFTSSSSFDWDTEELIGKLSLTFLLVSAQGMIFGLLGFMRAKVQVVRLFRFATGILSGSFTLLSTLILWEFFDTWWMFPGEIEARIWSVLLILSIAGLFGTPAVHALEIARRKDAAESGLPMQVKVALTCPRCEHSQSISTGGGECVACGLSINVQVEEPQCSACGYSLAKLDASTCPECGTDIHHKG